MQLQDLPSSYLPSFPPRRGLVKFAIYNAPDESADTGALPAKSVQLGFGPLVELHHYAFHFHCTHLLSLHADASMLAVANKYVKLF